MSAAFWIKPGQYAGEALTEDVSPWDIFWLANQRVPGLVSWPSGSLKYKIDVKRAKGQNGASMTQQGKDPTPFSIKAQIWLPEHWEQLQTLLAIIAPKDNKPLGDPVPAIHPALQAYGIYKVLVEEIQLPTYKGKGAGEFSIKMIQWSPSPKKVGSKTPKKAKKDAAGGIVKEIKDAISGAKKIGSDIKSAVAEGLGGAGPSG